MRTDPVEADFIPGLERAGVRTKPDEFDAIESYDENDRSRGVLPIRRPILPAIAPRGQRAAHPVVT